MKDTNIEQLETQVLQESSEVDLFNKIGFMAEVLGYHPVYFKSLIPKLVKIDNELLFNDEYINYLQLYKNEDMKISIYYDKFNLGHTFQEVPYYELYYKNDIQRFFDTEEDRSNLLETLSKYL